MADDMQKRVIQHAQEDLGKVGPEVAAQPGRPGLGDRMKDHFIDRFVPEVGDMLSHKISQGAAELAQALNSQADGYVPYGTGQKPLEIEGPAMSYQDQLRDAAQRAGQEQDRGMDR
jgi:hypothetical protein